MKTVKRKRKYIFFKNNTKVGLALGGGGARGFVHVGVLKAFEEEGIEFDFVAGTSVGALIGGMYANGMTSDEMLESVKNLKIKDIRPSPIPLLPSKPDAMEKTYKDIIGDITFDELKTPFCAVSVDIRTGKEMQLMSGSVVKSAVASACVPGLFLPVRIDDMVLFDGGLLNNLPANVAKKQGCDIVIAVDINNKRGGGTKSDKYLDMVFASFSIMMKNNNFQGYLNSDVLISPDTQKFSSTKIVNKDEMVRVGYEAAMAKMPEIKSLIGIKENTPSLFERFKSRNKKVLVDKDGNLVHETEKEEGKDYIALEVEPEVVDLDKMDLSDKKSKPKK